MSPSDILGVGTSTYKYGRGRLYNSTRNTRVQRGSMTSVSHRSWIAGAGIPQLCDSKAWFFLLYFKWILHAGLCNENTVFPLNNQASLMKAWAHPGKKLMLSSKVSHYKNWEQRLIQRRNRNMFVERSNVMPLYHGLETELIPEPGFKFYQDSDGSEAVKMTSTLIWWYSSYGLWLAFLVLLTCIQV